MDNRDKRGRFTKGFRHTKETRKKIGDSHRGIKFTEQWKKNVSEGLKKLHKNNPELGKKIGERNRGTKLSEETKRKISLNHADFKGKNCPAWNGGVKKHSSGYKLIWDSSHPYSNKENYVYEHRLVMEKHLGRYLKPEEQVHHINGIKDDNRIENLMLFESNSAHLKYHNKLRAAKN